MFLTVNGDRLEVPDGLDVAGLLQHLNLRTEGRAVAVNLTFVPRTKHRGHLLHEGDEVEVVAPMQGG